MRKWLVRNFVLGTYVKVFGVKFHTLRAPRVLFPMFVFGAMFIMGSNPADFGFEWYHTFIYFIWALGIWLGFNFFTWSYFSLKPPTYEEMDDEQKYDFLRAINLGVVTNPEQGDKYGYLTEEQLDEFKRLKEIHEEKYKDRFAGLISLYPVTISILSIISWYIWMI